MAGAGTIFDVIDAYHEADRRKVTAASLGRVWQHVSSATGFGILTAYRAGYAPHESQARQRSLQSDIRALRLGYFHLVGHWRECADTEVKYDDCPEEQLSDVQEPSLFVPGLALSDALRLGRKYDQDAVVYGGPDAGGKTVLAFRDGSQHVIASTMTPRAVGQAYSALARKRQRKFSFVAYVSTSPAEIQAATVYQDVKYGSRKYSASGRGAWNL